MVMINFNASGVAVAKVFDPIPSGEYRVKILKSEEKPTKTPGGFFIEFEMEVIDGEHQGRKVYDRLNIKNANQTAVDIAYSTLSSLCHVTGRLHIQDTQQLHNIPFIAMVSKVVRKDLPPPGPGEQPTYGNEVKGYKDINGNLPGSTGQGAAPQQGGGGGQPAWAQPGGAPQPQPAAPYGAPQYGQPAQGQPQGGQPWQGQPPQQMQPAQQPQPGYPAQNGQPAQPQPQQPPPWNGQAAAQPQMQPQQQLPPQQQMPEQQVLPPQQPVPGGAPPWVQQGAPAA